MGNWCGNPGVGIDPKLGTRPDYDAYNPGEVRLYGRPGMHSKVGGKFGNARVEQQFKAQLGANKIVADEKIVAKIANAIYKDAIDFFNAAYQRIVFAVINGTYVNALPVDINMGSSKSGGLADYINSIGVIYGYAYEGHCYKLPTPQIMFLPQEAKQIVGDKCAFDCGYSPELGYAVWQIDKLERVVVLDVRSDDLKTLLLDENLPGNRSPLAYSQSMALAPQRARD